MIQVIVSLVFVLIIVLKMPLVTFPRFVLLQLIIDECGMCTEPEALVPIVCHNVHQVVLIGDHQQLRPIVLNDTARMLGLERSMFERYSEHAKMLTVQYRMVRSSNVMDLISSFI